MGSEMCIRDSLLLLRPSVGAVCRRWKPTTTTTVSRRCLSAVETYYYDRQSALSVGGGNLLLRPPVGAVCRRWKPTTTTDRQSALLVGGGNLLLRLTVSRRCLSAVSVCVELLSTSSLVCSSRAADVVGWRVITPQTRDSAVNRFTTQLAINTSLISQSIETFIHADNPQRYNLKRIRMLK